VSILLRIELPKEESKTDLTYAACPCTNDRNIEEMCDSMDTEKVDYFREKLRKAIAAKIKREGWSQTEAGRLCETSRVHMNHLLRGKGWAALPKMIQVAEDLGLRVDLVIEDRASKEK
jgi:hypothetical protein